MNQEKSENISNNDIDCDTPVTIIVKRRPKPGMEKEFEEVISGISRAAMSFKGHLGINIFRPTPSTYYYRIVFKFDSRRNFIAWETSDIRQQWLQKFNNVDMGDPQMEVLSGLETWFTTADEEAVVPPPRYKMMVVVWLSVFPLSILLNYLLRPLLGELHIILQIAIISIVIVVLMTYIVMPFMSRFFHKWLHSN
jgi:uncharacterized protein